MPKTDFTQYDKDPANNTDVDGVDIAEGCAPSGINNAIRSVMSHIAEMNDGTVAMTSPSIPSISGSVDVTGTVTADGLTLNDGTNSVDITSSGSDTRLDFVADRASSNLSAFRFQGSSGNFQLDITDGGDISFYENTGTTAKFFWDASAESLGIGTSSPNADLELGGVGEVIRLSGSSTNAYIRNTDGTTNQWYIGSGGNAGLQHYIYQAQPMTFHTSGTERMRVTSDGDLWIAKTTAGLGNDGHELDASGYAYHTRSGANVLYLNRKSDDGGIVTFYQAGGTVGSIGTISGDIFVGTGDTNLRYNDAGDDIRPSTGTGAGRDNAIDLGDANARFDDIYATNGTIQTSDRNEKENIASMSDAEITAAKAISKLFKTFKWKDAVAEKGDSARTHAGVIAQDVQQAMADAGLDAGNYAFFISSTWWETQTEVPAVEAVEAVDAIYEDVVISAVEEQLDEEGNVIVEAQPERVEQRLVSEAVEAVEGKETYTRTDTYDTAEEAPEGATERTRLGIRYPELLAFIGAATEQRLASIEARLDALEA